MARNKRIDSIVEALKGYHTALDIGTDHGYVLKHALDQHYIKKGIASDLRKQLNWISNVFGVLKFNGLNKPLVLK